MRNLARLLTSQGPVNWEIARQMAQWAATGGEPERNADPVARVRLEELLRVAEMHVAEATGLAVSSGGLLTVRAVTPREWALRTLEDWKPLLEKLAGTMTATWPGEDRPGGAGRRARGRRGVRAGRIALWIRDRGARRRGGRAVGQAGRPVSIPWPSCSGTCPRCWGPSCSACRPDRWSGSWPSGPWASTTSPCPGPSGTS